MTFNSGHSLSPFSGESPRLIHGSPLLLGLLLWDQPARCNGLLRSLINLDWAWPMASPLAGMLRRALSRLPQGRPKHSLGDISTSTYTTSRVDGTKALASPTGPGAIFTRLAEVVYLQPSAMPAL